MNQDIFEMYGEIDMSQETEVLKEREHLFVPVTLGQCEVYCGDKRPPVGYEGKYIHVFGGMAPNLAYNLSIVGVANGGEPLGDSFASATGSITALLIENKVQPGVHSDEASEQGGTVKTDQAEGDVGCKYLQVRPDISRHIVENGDNILVLARELRPELFSEPEDIEFAKKVVDAHKTLIEKPGFITTGRDVALAATEQGAPTMVVASIDDASHEGVLNQRPKSTYDTERAMQEGLLAYDQDHWAVMEGFSKIRHIYPYDVRQVDIAETIDAIGTFQAVGVSEITPRK